MKYMMMMHTPRGPWEIASWPPADINRHIEFMKEFAKELAESGQLVDVQGLASPDEARIVRSTKAGTPAVTDGPFPEAKEFLAGYWIVDVETTEQAYALAARASSAPGKGGVPMNLAIEVRQVMSAPKTEDGA